MFNANLDLDDKIWLNESKREQFDEYIVTCCSKGLVHKPLHLFRPRVRQFVLLTSDDCLEHAHVFTLFKLVSLNSSRP